MNITQTVMLFNKQHIKQLITDFSQAQERCRAIERDARDARGEVDTFKMQLLELHKAGIELRSGTLEAIVTETPREGYVVKPSVRQSIVIKNH